MKTISLTDEAYQRLLVWREQSRDSFSKVVPRVVPPEYSGAAIAEAVQRLPPLTEEQELRIRESLTAAKAWTKVGDPGTT